MNDHILTSPERKDLEPLVGRRVRIVFEKDTATRPSIIGTLTKVDRIMAQIEFVEPDDSTWTPRLWNIATVTALTTIGDVVICKGEPPDGNPYRDRQSLIFEPRRKALEAYRDGEPTEGLTFWHAPTNGGARRITSPDEIDWRGMGR